MTRSFSNTETSNYWRSKLDYYRSVICWVEYKEAIDRATLCGALKNLIAKEPALVLNSIDGKSLGPIDKILFDDVVEFNDDVTLSLDLDDQISRLHDVMFELDSDKPLWRLYVYGRHLVFVCDHLCIDGTGVASFQQGLLQELQTASPADDPLLYNGSPVEIPGRLEDYVRIPQPTAAAATSSDTKYFDHQTSTQASLKTLVKTLSFNHEELQSLLRLSRAHNVHLTALLSYFGMLAFDKTFRHQDEDPAATNYLVKTAVNLRRYFDKPSQAPKVACYPSELLICIPSTSLQILDWAKVQQFDSELHARIESGEPLSAWAQPSTADKFLKMDRMFNLISFVNSNLGYNDLPGATDAWFSQSAAVTGGNVVMNVISFQKGLRLCFTWDAALPDAELAPAMVDRMAAFLQDASQ